MKRYIGGDVHAASVAGSVRSAMDEIVRRDVIETHGKAPIGYIAQGPRNLYLCI